MIEFASAGKKYGRRDAVIALQPLTLTIPRGTVCAIVGPNGAGKSTLIGLLPGFLRASSGAVLIDGMHPKDYVDSRGVGYVPERFSLPAAWPVRRAIVALCGIAGLPRHAADEALSAFGLTDHSEKRIGDLSRGLLQRVGLAQAFAADHELLILDEPTEGLDPVWRIRLRDRITARRDAGLTTVLASHDLAEVERVADMVIVLERGALREVVRTAAHTDSLACRLQLAAPCDAVMDVFSSAAAIGDTTYLVHAASTDDLNQRLAALIELGGRILSMEPGDERLEERLRRTMQS